MTQTVVLLTGGVGGAKLALGLSRVLAAEQLTVVVNTGDDFDHFGLRICPDIDTTLYTLSGLANTELGWGRGDESWSFMETLGDLGGEDWFQLGDRDLAMHILRTQALTNAGSLTGFTAKMAEQLNVGAKILPASEDRIPTQLETSEGTLAFQDYFVRRRCTPEVKAVHYRGAQRAVPAPGIMEDLTQRDLLAVIIAPSNPYLSIAPILAIPGIRSALENVRAPVIAVTPIIGGEAVKGPTAKIMKELGLESSPITVAEYYRDLIDGFVLDCRDEGLLPQMPVETCVTNTLMNSLSDRERLAAEVLSFARSLSGMGERQ